MPELKASLTYLRRMAEAVGVLAFGLMFISFILQVFTRYVLKSPLAWTSEVCVIGYLWIAFWGGGLLVGRKEQIRFDLVYQAFPQGGRRVVALVSSLALATIFLWGVKPNVEYVRFMAQESTPILGIRLDLLFSVFLVFMIAVILRALIRAGRLLGGNWRQEV